MRMRRAHEQADRLAGHRGIVDEAATAAEQGIVLDARELFGLGAMVHNERFGG